MDTNVEKILDLVHYIFVFTLVCVNHTCVDLSVVIFQLSLEL
jgi:hypothetical protein